MTPLRALQPGLDDACLPPTRSIRLTNQSRRVTQRQGANVSIVTRKLTPYCWSPFPFSPDAPVRRLPYYTSPLIPSNSLKARPTPTLARMSVSSFAGPDSSQPRPASTKETRDKRNGPRFPRMIGIRTSTESAIPLSRPSYRPMTVSRTPQTLGKTHQAQATRAPRATHLRRISPIPR